MGWLKKIFAPRRRPRREAPSVSVYAVFRQDGRTAEELADDLNSPTAENLPQPASFAGSHEEAMLVIERLWHFDALPHYAAWCSSRGIPMGPFGSEQWELYKAAVASDSDPAEGFRLIKMTYRPGDVAALMRAFSGCAPTGLPHETRAEADAFASRITRPDGSIEVPEEIANPMRLDPGYAEMIAEAAKRVSGKGEGK